MTLPHHLLPTVADAAVGDLVELDGAEGHHAVAVRRLRAGERIALTDGVGTAVVAEVVDVGKRSLTARVLERRTDPAPAPSVTVVQALPKGDRGELAVEVLTEVGVATVMPWAASRCVAVWRGEREAKSHAKWAGAAREAAKQARRSWHPEVAPLATTDDVARLVSAADLAVVLHEDAAAPLAGLGVPAAGRIVVVVGPEGGLTEEEVERLTAAGAAAARLGTEVLRTSTAGVVAVAALLARTPRWGTPAGPVSPAGPADPGTTGS